ncbi:NAD-dependent succinate-semialdehyde dehydrogenase [Longimicrobium sp.]|uniref:NAD-dependent succinate-semialdehyde dehydrogenase n=1 Tax=Longimicrobium sp. TaxID=2029185 RepID=UPI002E335B46|nr:NAD-dependent succinate-semialdehyde dehydrogenase [Longimicrobium sp.]HEX6041159.1 NAD-dependent succinate-semialdehyde dehydrogenase [Longimicrobium sp.]
MPIATINPATGETLRTFDALTPEQLEHKLQRASDAFSRHRRTSIAQRAEKMRRAGELLDAEKEKWARLMTMEMGKTLAAARAEAEKCAWVCRHYADHAERMLAARPVDVGGTARGEVHFLPIGAVLAVMPWNFPFWQVFRFAAPGLMAGNVGLLKHASNVPQCALAIEEIFLRAGFEEGVFQALLIGSDAVAGILDDPRVAAATLTGSTPAGQSVAERAGRNLKKTVLELGGSDPFIVMPSADLDAAARTAARARCINNGQSCIAAKRFIVHAEVADAFAERFVAEMRRLRVGDPMADGTDVGPLATAAIRDEVAEQVRASVKAGARVLTGGEPMEGPGFFYPPTVLSEVPEDAPAYHEEVFGPVATIFRAAGIDEAIALANDSVFGLGSSVWTRDEDERRRFVDEIEAGMTYVNAMVASDPRLPFGGVKQSGYGRELGEFGIHEFVNIKSVWIEDGAPETLPDAE